MTFLLRVLLVCSVAVLSPLMTRSTMAQDMLDVWIGTGGGPAKGIYHATLNTKSGMLSDTTLAAEIKSPGFLAMHPKGTHLYAVGSLDEPCVAAYRISGKLKDAKLTFLNSVPIGDGGAAHIAVDPTGSMILTAQYGGGSTAAFKLNEDGSVKERTALVDHVDETKKSHAHWAGFSPDNRFGFVPDLGFDKVIIYKVDPKTATINPHGAGILPPGAGPRHMKFHTTGKWAYVLHEHDLAVTVYDYDAKAGTMKAKQTILTVPKDELDDLKAKSCSEIRVHPSGKFVYAANRGHDTITAFRVNQETGELSEIEREHVRGATPRNFNLDPSGKWLIAAGQQSHNLAVFEVNQETGELIYNVSNVLSPAPICVLFQHE
ncbi:MAG: lactonase family protein [Planctomycetota bacterium]|nr:lactonase family protein [Planctomycetota bacterium]MDA1252342.1 lactonase family protein [Planctomycetota bacterium]